MLTEFTVQSVSKNSACDFIELVTRLCSSMSHFNVEYSHLLDDTKSSLCKNLILNEGFNSTEDILSCIHKELLILTDLVMCANFPTDTGLMPYNFRYNIVNDEKEPLEKEDKILPSRNDFYQTTRKLATNAHYQTFDDKAPACSDSPPIRDTDTWTPNRKRALHEPTEKQLRNSQESRIRQLQAKLSQYSDALEEIRAKCLSNKAQSQELGSTCKVQKKFSEPNLQYRNLTDAQKH
ncbi:unnamed protein product [Schistosoma curassoni]|nr:unnamed protein product [Schistosoma curassoni]